MIAALVTYPAWERDAAETARRFPLPPTATERQCAAALDALPEHPVKVHLFEPPLTKTYGVRQKPHQFLAAVLGVMALRYRDATGFRLGRGRYLVHGGEKASPADGYLLELATRDGNRGTCVLTADEQGGELSVTFGAVCREPYGLTRWLGQWASIILPLGLLLGVALFLLFLVGCWGVLGALALLVGYGEMVRNNWAQGAVPSRDNKTMPADGAAFARQVEGAIQAVIHEGAVTALTKAGWQPEGPLSLDDEDERRVRARPVTPPADPKPEPPVRDDRD